jgi:subtilisin family serine protease
MRTPPPSARALAALLLALVALAAGAAPAADDAGAAGWQGLLGSRPLPQLGSRWIVVLRAPSLADRVRRAGGGATERQMRAWTAAARDAQQKAIVRLAFRGAPIDAEQSYVRVLNGFAAALDPRLIPVLERDPLVAGVYPVRAVYPAALPDPSAAVDMLAPGGDGRVGIALPGSDGTGVTVALLDTGVDRRHPYLQGRLLPGIDELDPGSDASAAQNPTLPGRPERHGTELAGLVAGSRGPAGIHGVAPRASVLPIRVAGWQPDAEGGVSVYGRSDQLLAGLEAAVDPDADGDAHDAARIALVGVVEPFASFSDAPLARAARGALALGTLVVAPAGNDGAAGPGYGSVAAPGGTSGALGVAAIDSRRRSPTAHVLLRAGLRVLVSGETPLGGAFGPGEVVAAPVVALPRRQVVAVTEGNALDRLFDSKGYSRVAGTAALLPPGPTTPEVVSELSAAGVRAVLVQGPIPAGSLGVDDPVEVPIVGIPVERAQELRAALRSDIPVELSVGASAFDRNGTYGAVAPFSSTGLAFDGNAQPELGAPGVGLVTSMPGRNEGGTARYGTISGSSAAAAVVAGAAALLADARPDLDAAGLRAALVATVRRGAGGSSVGLVNPEGASAAELVADPPTVSLGALGTSGRAKAPVVLRNVSRRPLTVRLRPGQSPTAVTVETSRSRLVLRPGGSATIELSIRVATRPSPPSALAGALVATAGRGVRLRVPWSVAIPVTSPVVSAVALSRASFAASDQSPAVLSLVAGRVDGSAERPQILPLERLDIELYRGAKRLGPLVVLRDLLPGRYALGVTGRGPAGARLPAGSYTLRVVGTPVGRGKPTVVKVPFRLR